MKTTKNNTNEIRKEIFQYLKDNQESIAAFDEEKIKELKEKYQSGDYSFVNLHSTNMYGITIHHLHQFVPFEEIKKDINDHVEKEYGNRDKHYTFVLLPKKYEEELREWHPMYLQDIIMQDGIIKEIAKEFNPIK